MTNDTLIVILFIFIAGIIGMFTGFAAANHSILDDCAALHATRINGKVVKCEVQP